MCPPRHPLPKYYQSSSYVSEYELLKYYTIQNFNQLK
jgi:hypothetical protein